MRAFPSLLFMLLACAVIGCRTTPSRMRPIPDAAAEPGIRTNSIAVDVGHATNAPAGRWHTVVIQRPAKDVSIRDRLNPVWWFGNIDDPEPPEWYRPGEKGRRFKWRLRNPFHNFTFYVIGIADKTHRRSGYYPRRVANPNGGWNVSVSKLGCLRLPFVSYTSTNEKFVFYLGWRASGNFGFKININPSHRARVYRMQNPSETPNESPSAGVEGKPSEGVKTNP